VQHAKIGRGGHNNRRHSERGECEGVTRRATGGQRRDRNECRTRGMGRARDGRCRVRDKGEEGTKAVR
jgi:hypothetical protein